MTLTEAEKLNIGDTVRWPEGVNGCKECSGVVGIDPRYNAKCVMWSDGQVTYLHDKDAVAFIEATRRST